MKQHYREVDILKGIAILMVLLGHSIIVHPINLNEQYGWCNYLHWFVSTVHMPLFFTISGFCFGFHDWKSYIIKKSRRILIPYFSFGLLGIFVNLFFSSFVNNPNSFDKAAVNLLTGQGNWFLCTLFVIFLIFPFIKNIYNSLIHGLVITIILGGFQFFAWWPSIFNIDNVAKYIFYFSVGFLCKSVYKHQPEYWKKLISFVNRLDVMVASYLLLIILVCMRINLGKGSHILYVIVSMLAAIIGIIGTVSFTFFISKFSFSILFEETGKVSLQLFLLNGYFLTITRTITVRLLHISSPMIIIAANLFVMYLVSFLFIKLVIERVKLFRILTGMV